MASDSPALRHSHSRYGYREPFTGFREILRLDSDGIWFRARRRVPWSSVVALRAYPDFRTDFLLGRLQPRLVLYLKDGGVLRIRGEGLRRDCATCDSEKRVAGLPAAYASLVRELRSRGVPDWTAIREEDLLLRVFAGASIFLGSLAFWLAKAGMLPGTQPAIEWAGDSLAGAAILALVATPILGRHLRRRLIAATGALQPGTAEQP